MKIEKNNIMRAKSLIIAALIFTLLTGIYSKVKQQADWQPLPSIEIPLQKAPASYWLREDQWATLIYYLHEQYPDSNWINQLYQKLNNPIKEDRERKGETPFEFIQTPEQLAWQLKYHPTALCTATFTTNDTGSIPLSEFEKDYLATIYCQLKDNLHLAVVSAKVSHHSQEIIEAINIFGRVLYTKEVAFTRLGQNNLLLHMYGFLCKDPHNWVKDNSKVEKHIHSRHQEGASTLFILFETSSLERANYCKYYIRKNLGMKTTGIHVTDTAQETTWLSQLVFNADSRALLNHRKFSYNDESSPSIRSLAIAKQSGDCLGPDATWYAYECVKKDLAFSVLEGKTRQIEEVKIDPSKHFYFQGAKIISLRAIEKLTYRSLRGGSDSSSSE
ncbi:MAG: hypothetical protein K0S74_933 [Chlamydiales bacterium]|jgi:hypothetical protein|nr:hypothetical protein [Chlamydiales bacterium]